MFTATFNISIPVVDKIPTINRPMGISAQRLLYHKDTPLTSASGKYLRASREFNGLSNVIGAVGETKCNREGVQFISPTRDIPGGPIFT